MQDESVTQNVTFAWWSERWQSSWADSPDEVPEWDVSRVGSGTARKWARIFTHDQNLIWAEYRDYVEAEVRSPPPENPDNYPRLVIRPDENLKAGIYATPPEGDVLTELLQVREFIESADSMKPGSQTRTLILELANRWGPYALSANDPRDNPNTLSLRSWAVGICRLSDVLQVIAKLRTDLEILSAGQAITDLKQHVKEQASLEYPMVEGRISVRPWPPTAWNQIDAVLKKCHHPRDVRQRLANYLFDMFGGSGGLHFGPFTDQRTQTQKLQLVAYRGTIGWAYFLAAQAIMGGTVRRCAASGCSNIIASGRRHKDTCSDACRQRKSRGAKLKNPVTNL
jgi:hypothetical protein